MTEDSSSKGTPGTASPTLKGVGDALLDGLPFSVGSIIAGKYRVDRVIGSGGMGVILAGHHVALDQRVAIKVLKPDAIGNAEYVARFTREARASARLRSEHVARVLDVGEAETGLPYMVMEYLSGKDLSRVVRERGPLSVLDAAEYVMQACEGLAEAHRAGIVHRDLKPANLFLTTSTDGSPLVKVLDFGISKLLARPEDTAPTEGLTQTQAMIGSPHYMSPEQLKSARDVDARTDIWSLGGVLFKLLTNEAAFEGASTPELCVSILVGSPRELRKLRPEVPEALVRVVMKCLEKDPAARYASVGELAGALAAFAPSHSASSVERIVRVGASADPRETTSEPPPGEARPPAASSTLVMPGHLEMTTLTSSAASLSTTGAASDSVLAARVRPGRMVPIVIAAIAAVALLGGLATFASLGRGNGDAGSRVPAAATQLAPTAAPIPPPVESAVTPIIATRTAAAPPQSSGHVAASSAGSSPSAPASHGAGAPARPTAPPRATAAGGKPSAPPQTGAAAKPTAAPPPPPPPTSGVPDFGGRK